MILCHDRQLIFFKTRKTGSTSFEIALAEVCGPDDVITPLAPEDEALRAALGIRGAQNFAPRGPFARWRSGYFNHISTDRARKLLSRQHWNRYARVAIHRNPWDVAVSRYFWRRSLGEARDFGQYIAQTRSRHAANLRIAPLSGPGRVTHVLRYEHLAEDAAKARLADVAAYAKTIRAKSGTRPETASSAEVYTRYPEAARIIAEECGELIRTLGYRPPL